MTILKEATPMQRLTSNQCALLARAAAIAATLEYFTPDELRALKAAIKAIKKA